MKNNIICNFELILFHNVLMSG